MLPSTKLRPTAGGYKEWRGTIEMENDSEYIYFGRHLVTKSLVLYFIEMCETLRVHTPIHTYQLENVSNQLGFREHVCIIVVDCFIFQFRTSFAHFSSKYFANSVI